MPSHQDAPKIDPERCLEALTLAISRCRHRFIRDTANLRLTCKELKRLVDDLFNRSLFVSEGWGGMHRETDPDFDILTPALLKNVQKIHISLLWEDSFADIPRYEAGVKRILDWTSHNLRELSINEAPSLAALIKDNFTWPHLEKLILRTGKIAEVKHELYSMRNLRFLHLNFVDSNRHDRRAFLSLPLANLTQLELYLSWESRTPLYMSKLFTRASQLQKLDLFGGLDYNYFGGIHLQNLKELTLDGYKETLLSPLLERPYPDLRRLNISFAFLPDEELENFILSAKVAFPNLESLALGQSNNEPDIIQDWSCLSSIDLPNLTDLTIHCGFKEVIGIVAPTAKLPKLRTLMLGTGIISKSGHPKDWEDYAEQMFSSKLVQQLEELSIKSRNFRIASLEILCKYSSQFKNLYELEVHVYDIQGLAKIAVAGLTGGFPRLKRIVFHEMNDIFKNEPTYIDARYYVFEIAVLLTPVWPDIDYYVWIGGREAMQKYGQPDEFEETDPFHDDLNQWFQLELNELQ
jgi:hypothetical protein